MPAPDASEADRAFHALLLTHARYKNFIDETDDSLINTSVRYFLAHGSKEDAARALHFQGVIRMNAGNLGGAAVSLSQGLDLARECGAYMWEGQCARRLFLLYCDLMEGSSQVRYAKESYDAFSKGGFDEWKDYAALDIATAYNNSGQYENAISESEALIKTSLAKKDTFLLKEAKGVLATSLNMTERHREALGVYAEVNDLDSLYLTANDKSLISVALANVNKDSLPENINKFVGSLTRDDSYRPLFSVLAYKGDFEGAYSDLVKYKNMQDSVLSVILKNNVSEAVDQYETSKKRDEASRLMVERTLYAGLVIILFVIIAAVCVVYNSRVKRKENEYFLVRSDLEKMRISMDFNQKEIDDLQEKNNEMTETLRYLVRDMYAEEDRLCDRYFGQGDPDDVKEVTGNVKKKRLVTSKEIGEVIMKFTDEAFLKGVAENVDRCVGGIYTSFRTDFPEIDKDGERLFLYLTLGFCSRTISVLLKKNIDVVYNRKSRLKALVKHSDVAHKEEYLKFFNK